MPLLRARWPERLTTSRTITDRHTIERLTSVLDSDRPGFRVTHGCTGFTYLDEALIAFGYPSSRNVNVFVGLTGCQNPTNGEGMALQLESAPSLGLRLAKEFNSLVPVPGHPHLEETFYRS